MLPPWPARAQKPNPESSESAAKGSAPAPKAKKGKRKITLDDELVVEGVLEKPKDFFIFRRSATDYDWARLEAHFSPLVLESVQDPLF